MENNSRFLAAAVQTAPVFLSKDETIGKVISLIEEASREGASLIVFPEATVPCYPYWPKDLGTAEGRKLVLNAYTELYKNSIEIPGEETLALCVSAKEADANVVIGVNERDGGTLYNTIVYIDNRGTLLGKHRKLMSIDSERCIWGMGNAEDLAVFDTDIGRVGGFFCYEHHLTLAKYAMYLKGEQIHAGLWAGHGFVKPTMDFASRQYAFEGQVFVVVSSGYINSDMIPDSFPLKQHTSWDYPGGSGIINPRGEYIAGPVYDREEIVYAEIDTDMIIRAKAVIDAAGHFSRPDILNLEILDRQAQGPTNNNPPPVKTDNRPKVAEQINEVKKDIDEISSKLNTFESQLGQLLEKLSNDFKEK